MADGGEVKVDLRLSLDKIAQDAKSAGVRITKNLASSVKGLPPTPSETEDTKAKSKRDRERQNRLTEQRYEWARQREEEMKAARQRATDQSVSEASRRNRARQLMRQRAEDRRQGNTRAQMDRSRFGRNAAFAALPAMGNLSPLSVFASYRQAFKAFSTTQTGAGLMARAGLSGTGGAAIAAGALTTAAVAVGVSLLALRKVVAETSEAFSRAAQLYSQVIRSGGLGSRYVVQQAIASRVMGGGDPYAAGAPGMLAMSMTRRAAASLAETMPQLTMTVWKSRAAIVEMEAAFARLATTVAPAINRVADALKGLAASPFFDHILKLAAVGMKGIVTGQGPAVFITTAIEDMFKKKGLPTSERVPLMPAATQRIPPSAWEKMGLVVGFTNRSDYQKKTAENTQRIAQILAHIAGKDGYSISTSAGSRSTYNIPRSNTPILSPAFSAP